MSECVSDKWNLGVGCTQSMMENVELTLKKLVSKSWQVGQIRASEWGTFEQEFCDQTSFYGQQTSVNEQQTQLMNKN